MLYCPVPRDGLNVTTRHHLPNPQLLCEVTMSYPTPNCFLYILALSNNTK